MLLSPSSVEQMLLLENEVKTPFFLSITEGHLGRTHRCQRAWWLLLAAAGTELVTFSFYMISKKHWANLTALNVPWLGRLAW